MARLVEEVTFNSYWNAAERGDFDDIPKRISDFIAWLQSEVSRVPDEFKDSAMIEVDVEGGWDCYSPIVRISYIRPESEQEETVRVACESERKRKRLERVKAEYERLSRDS